MKKTAFSVLLLSLLILPGLAVKAQEGEYKPRELGPTFEEKAIEALVKGDYPEAIDYYKKWLEASPKDGRSWYNLACAYALAGRSDEALDAFETSVDAGFTDFEHAAEDKDLDSIRERERFKAAQERSKAAASKKDGPADFVRHSAAMRVDWTYIVALPPGYEDSGKRYPLCVILHGAGSTEMRHGKLADTLGREDVIYVCPRAPYPHPGVFMGLKREGYTSGPPYDIEEGSAAGNRFLHQYVDWIFSCIEDARKRYRVDGGKAYLLGHSQGSFLANACAALRPAKIASYFAYAGGMPEALQDARFFKGMRRHKVRPYLVHCEDDKVVSVSRTKENSDSMKKAGVDFEFKIFEEGGHGLTDKVKEYAKEWILEEVLESEKAPPQS